LLHREAGYISATGIANHTGHHAPAAECIHGRRKIDYATRSAGFRSDKMRAMRATWFGIKEDPSKSAEQSVSLQFPISGIATGTCFRTPLRTMVR
jgi:hypothetical protein